MCPQASDGHESVSELKREEGGSADLNPRRLERMLKRSYEGHAPAESVFERLSVPDHRGVRRPVARYRRSFSIDAGASGSAEAPIVLHGDGSAGNSGQAAGPEIIDLDSEVDDATDASQGASSVFDRVEMSRGESSRQRSFGVGEPAPKRVCKATEGARRSVDTPPAVGGGRPARSSGFLRGSGRPWARERMRQQPTNAQTVTPMTPINVDELDLHPANHPQPLDEDERFARQLQDAFSTEASVSGNDADLARVLQEEENRRLFRAPPPVPVDHARLHLLYLRQMVQAGTHHASSSRQGEAPRQRSRVFGGDVRRFRSLEERLSAFGALLQRRIPLALQLAYVDRDFNENDYEMLLALDEGVKQRGAPQAKIDELPVTEVQEVNKNEPCSICLEVPEQGEQMRHLPCMHGFHQNCIDTWLQRRANCPVCKAAI